MFCQKLLMSSNDPQSFYLIENEDFPHRDTTLDKIIPDFFKKKELSVHIAVVCGRSEIWSAEEFKNVLVTAHQDERVTSFSIELPLESTTVGTTYSSLIVEDADTSAELSGKSMIQVGAILTAIKDKLAPNSDTVTEPIEEAVSHLKSIGKAWQDRALHIAFDEYHAESFTKLLEGLRKSNSFPQVMILIYLPVEAFDFFDHHSHNFPKQIEYVLKAGDTNTFIQDLENKLSTVTKERDALKAQVDILMAADAEKDTELAEKGAKLAELATIIQEKDTEIDDLKRQIQQWHQAVARGLQDGISAIAQMVGSISPLDDVYTRDLFKIVFENLSTPQLENAQSSLNQILEDRAQDNPHYAEFIPPPYNPKKPKEINNPVVESTDESVVEANIDIEKAEEKDSIGPDAIQRTKENLNRSRTEYEEDMY